MRTEKVRLMQIRATCGLPMTEIHRISGLSRMTLHKLEREEAVRFDTAALLLQRLYESPKCERGVELISEELRRIGAPKRDLDVDRVTLDAIEAASDEVNMLLSSDDKIMDPHIYGLLVDLRDDIEELLSKQRLNRSSP